MSGHIYYNVVEVYLDSDGVIRERILKRTQDNGVAQKFMEIAFQLKQPKTHIYIVVTEED